MEYVSGGELFDYISSKKRLTEIESCRIFQELISGVEYIHQLGIVHRDLKPENLLLTNNKTIKIVDFGLSNTYNDAELLQTACGSPCYAPPEMISGVKYLGPSADIWSTGVILFVMVAGYLPFEDDDTSELYRKILNSEYEVPEWVSPLTKQFLKKLLEVDPKTRYNIEQIRNHLWFNQIQANNLKGIFVGYNGIPVNKDILEMLEKFEISQEYCQKCLEANKHNNVTTTYYLLLKKFCADQGVVQCVKKKEESKVFFPFTPEFLAEFRPALRHRKYVEFKKSDLVRPNMEMNLKPVSINCRKISCLSKKTKPESGSFFGLKTEKIKIGKISALKDLNRSFNGKKISFGRFRRSPKYGQSRSVLGKFKDVESQLRN